MRWASQDIEHDDAGRLPGLGDTVIRRFDAPEALNIRFHEIRTKSALNRVPGASRLPFAWTVNPYRGCTHACAYCVGPETPVLLADGRTRAIADLRVGDRIVGTRREGTHRRYVATDVLAHWPSFKSAYRVTLDDGTELTASGDHRFLSRRGWKHVAGGGRRPKLTTSDALLGFGALASPPVKDVDYQRGYVCATLAPDAQVEREALWRAYRYLEELGVQTGALAYASSGARPAQVVPGATLRELLKWPWHPSPSWRRGFVAGIFDAAGECGESLRIIHADRAVVAQTEECLRALGFATTVERARGVRVQGGVAAAQRLLHVVDPADTAKRSIAGQRVRSSSRLRVASVEPLCVTVPMYDITTGTGDFIANGVISHNCFARPTHEYLDLDAGRDFEREIIVKVNVPEVLRAELAKPSWKGEAVALGTNTDPYQWVEGRYKLTRAIWEVMRDARNPCSILTKSPLLLRDLDVLKEIQQVAEVTACLSVPTLDEKAWRATEPHTPHPRARLEAVAELNRNGIPTGVLIAPLMPGVNDAREQVEKIVEIATEAKATYIGGQTLFLRGAVREIFFEWLREHRPDLLERYERLYAKGAYLPPTERQKIEIAAGAPWLHRYDEDPYRYSHRRGRRPPLTPPPAPPAARAPVTKQESLF